MKKEVYPLEQKLAVINEYLEGSIGIMRLANKYSISSTGDIRFWLERYKVHGVDGLKNVHNEKYSTEFKTSVVEYMCATGSSQQATAAHFNIPSRETVRRWQKLYEELGREGLISKPKGRMPMPRKHNEKNNHSKIELAQENQKLRMENAYLKKLYALIQSKNQPSMKK